MSNLSEFVPGGAAAGLSIGYNTSAGVYRQVSKRAGVAYLEYTNDTSVDYSLDGSTIAGRVTPDAPYVEYSDGFWIVSSIGRENPQTYVINAAETQ